MRKHLINVICRVAALILATSASLCLVCCDGEPVETGPEIATSAEPVLNGLEEMETIDRSSIHSDYAILCKLDTKTAVAGLRATERMYPASLTKLMTFIVAYENAADLTALIEITKELKNQYPEGSRVGIDVGDLLTVEQMMYALLLSSDTDAALGLAKHIAGGEAAFVELMNRKAEELGLTQTRFANVTGLHHKEHYTTPAEMAAILAYALGIDLGKTILTTETYVTWLKYYKPTGELADYRMTFYNTTLRDRFANNDIQRKTATGVTVLGGKTGLTDEAEYCLSTVAQAADGAEYILITGHAGSGEKSARDAVWIYTQYVK